MGEITKIKVVERIFVIVGLMLFILAPIPGEKIVDFFGLHFDVWILETIINFCVIFCGYIPFFIVHFYWKPKVLIKALLKSVYESNDIPSLQTTNTYRITCYRYVSNIFVRIFFLIKTFIKFGKKRKLSTNDIFSFNNKYLFCYSRYGFEYSGNKELKPRFYSTPTYFKVNYKKNIAQGFAGAIYYSNEYHKDGENFYEALNNCNINEIIQSNLIEHKGQIHGTLNDSLSKDELQKKISTKYTEYRNDNKGNLFLDKSTFNDIFLLRKMKNSLINNPDLSLEEKDFDEIINFMEKTNTNLTELFEIGEGRHSNHFLGFCLFKEKKLWGIVVIDILNNKSFSELCVGKKFGSEIDEEWVKYFLKNYINIFKNIVW